MRRYFFRWFCCRSLGGLAAAQDLDKAKLRAAVELPNIKLCVNISLDADRDDCGNRWDVAKEIAKEMRRLQGTVATPTFTLRSLRGIS